MPDVLAMKHHTINHKFIAIFGIVALCAFAGEANAEEQGDVEEGLAEAVGELSVPQEETTDEGASALAAAEGKCLARCCNTSVIGPVTTSSAAVCIQWVKSICENRQGPKIAKFSGVIIRAWECN